ncbi:hypothetical protein JA1_001061 [Spathaspora sp. JA1]|nr:hypothetical protein JA1_001061 [Spathaspora sp. JA1]
MRFIQKIFKNDKRFKTPLDSLPDEILALIFSNINQYDAINIGLLNKKLNQLVSVKLFKSLYVLLYMTELETPFEMKKSKFAYSPLMIKYTVVNGYDNLNLVIKSPQFQLVKNVFLKFYYPRYYSCNSYSYLTENCPWITIGVQSYRKDMTEKQFSSIDRISELHVSEWGYFPEIEYNVSIKRLNILGFTRSSSDPLALIPKLKSLTALCIHDDVETNIFDHFKEKNISGLKLKQLSLRVPQLSIREMDQMFELTEIELLDLYFYIPVEAYDDLKWLCTKMTKLGNISVGWSNVSFERVMNSLVGHRFYEIELKRYDRQEEFIEIEVLPLLIGHTSVIRFGIYGGAEFFGQIWEPAMIHIARKLTRAGKLFKYIVKRKLPNLVLLRINFDAYDYE